MNFAGFSLCLETWGKLCSYGWRPRRWWCTCCVCAPLRLASKRACPPRSRPSFHFWGYLLVKLIFCRLLVLGRNWGRCGGRSSHRICEGRGSQKLGLGRGMWRRGLGGSRAYLLFLRCLRRTFFWRLFPRRAGLAAALRGRICTSRRSKGGFSSFFFGLWGGFRIFLHQLLILLLGRLFYRSCEIFLGIFSTKWIFWPSLGRRIIGGLIITFFLYLGFFIIFYNIFIV